MGGYERSQLDRLASPFGHGTKHKLANEPGYQSCDLCCDELRTRVDLALSWYEGGMEYSSGDNGRRGVRARDFGVSGLRESTQRNLQRFERRCLSLEATVE